jgi:ribokinase
VTKVVVVGSINLDVVVPVPRLAGTGETVLGTDALLRPGGKGANQAVAAARLGARTVLVAATGDDHFGEVVRAALAAEPVDLTRVVTVPGAPTSLALIAVDPAGQNTVTVAAGANLRLDPSRDDLLDALQPGDVLLLQLEVPLRTCLVAAEAARRRGALVVLNAAPIPSDLDPAFAALLRHVDVLVVNETEGRQLRGHAGLEHAGDWRQLAKALRDLGPPVCVLTLGDQGAVSSTEGATHHQPAFPVAAVDTTGAGDAFSGAVAVALARGRPIAEAVRLGCAAGALATTSLGAQSALPTLAAVERFLAAPDPAAGR